ncbi:MAG TPA: hypothetical protein VKB80_17935 [Kofleriaceae bacterium]|nr:hypothetical protein [Kofleriaceae bacterium]
MSALGLARGAALLVWIAAASPGAPAAAAVAAGPVDPVAAACAGGGAGEALLAPGALDRDLHPRLDGGRARPATRPPGRRVAPALPGCAPSLACRELFACYQVRSPGPRPRFVFTRAHGARGPPPRHTA